MVNHTFKQPASEKMDININVRVITKSRAKRVQIRAFREIRERTLREKKYIREKQKIYNLNNETTTHNITMLATYICM